VLHSRVVSAIAFFAVGLTFGSRSAQAQGDPAKMPLGSGTLAIGKHTQSVTLTGTPQTQLKLTVPRALLLRY